MRHVIAYDITDDRRRARVACILLDYGERVQYSVFEADLTAKELDELLEKLRQVLDSQRDCLNTYRVCGACLPECRTVGPARVGLNVERWIL